MEENQCYICYEGEGSTNEQKFVSDPCNCKGSMKVHDTCFDQMCTHQNKCGACKAYWKHDYAGRKYVYSTNAKGEKHGTYEEYYGNGKLAYQGTYVNGKVEGIVRTWYKNGQLKSESNDIIGIGQCWYENGNLQEEHYFENRMLHGPITCYYENGNLKEQGNYVNGRREGFQQMWYENGQIKIEGNFHKGNRVGIHPQWNEDGTPIPIKEHGFWRSLWRRVLNGF